MDDAREYHGATVSLFLSSLEMMAEVTGRTLFATIGLPTDFLPDNSPNPEAAGVAYAIVRPRKASVVYDYPLTVTDGDKLHTYAFMTKEHAHAATIRPELLGGADYIVENHEDAIKKMLETLSGNPCDSDVVVALPPDCTDEAVLLHITEQMD